MEEFTIKDATKEQCIGYIYDQFGKITGTGLEHETRMSVVRKLASLCKEPESEE